MIYNASNISILVNLFKKEIKARHAGSVLGVLWSLFTPLSSVLVYTLVFKFIFQVNDPKFLLHLIFGLMNWQIFTSIFLQSPGWMLNNSSILKQINFPRMLIPFSYVGISLYYWLFFFGICFILYPFLGGEYTWALSVYPIYLVLFIGFIFGISLIFSLLAVTMRDLTYLIETLAPILMWLCPILWTSELLTGRKELTIVMYSNPFAVYMRAFESITYYNQFPSFGDTIAALVLTSLSLLFGVWFFRKHSRTVTEHF